MASIGYRLLSEIKSLLSRKILRADLIERRLARQIESLGLETIFDVGANRGQFAAQIRRAKFRGQIVSFEPISHVFQKLQHSARNDRDHHVYPFALGAEVGTAHINIASNAAASSSILPFNPRLSKDLAIEKVATEEIEVQTFDGFFSTHGDRWDLSKAALKMDVQGFERYVLQGASKSLNTLPLIYLETSFATLYEGEMLFEDMLNYMSGVGFTLTDIQPSLFIDDFKPLQCDVIFLRKN